MKLELAKVIVGAVVDEGIAMRLYEGYSGRGMMGKTTWGVVYESMFDLLQAIALASAKEPNLAVMVKMMRKDTMGRSHIIY